MFRIVRGCLRTIAGTKGETCLLRKRLPIPHSRRHRTWQPESELVREHAHLPAMMSFVRKHVAQDFRTNRPRRGPAVSAKLRDPTVVAERFGEHLRAASGALGQCRTGLLRRAVRTIELPRNLQM